MVDQLQIELFRCNVYTHNVVKQVHKGTQRTVEVFQGMCKSYRECQGGIAEARTVLFYSFW